MMKNKLNAVRTLSLGLALLLLLAIPAGAFAETVSVRIPSKLGNLSLPEMPDPLQLYTWTDSVPTYGNPLNPKDPCPILAVNDAIMHLQFSEQPDFAVASWYMGNENISVGADGYAELSTDGRRVQAGFTWDGVTKEKDWFIKAGKDGVTAGYTNSGKVRFIEYTVDGDFFDTGIEGAQTTFRFEPVTIDGDYYVYNPQTKKMENQKGKVRDASSEDGWKHWYYTNWYIPTITVVYPAGSGLTKIVAEYWNTEKATLKKFAVQYAPKGTYTCSYRMTVTKTPYDTIAPYARTIPVNDTQTIRVSGY